MRKIGTGDKGQGARRSIALCLGIFILVTCYLSLVPFVLAASWNPEEVLQQYLTDNYPWERIEISNVKVLGLIPDKAPETITVEKGPLGKGIFSFVFDDSRKIIVKADVRAFDQVVKSKWPFKKGYVLKTEDIYLSEVNIAKRPKNSVKDPEMIIGKLLNRSIIANISVTEDMVETLQTVDRGKKVILQIIAQGLNITALGETREKGYVGRPVKAINLSSKKEVIGVLIDEKTVKVEL